MTITLNNDELTALVRNGIRNYDLAGSAEIKFQAKKGGEVEAIITQSLPTEQVVPDINDARISKDIEMPTKSSQAILDKLTDTTPEGVR